MAAETGSVFVAAPVSLAGVLLGGHDFQVRGDEADDGNDAHEGEQYTDPPVPDVCGKHPVSVATAARFRWIRRGR